MRACRGCSVSKPLVEFRERRRGSRTYRMGKCRDCENAYQRDYAHRKGDNYRRRKRESMARRRAVDPQAVRDYQRQDYHANRPVRLAKMKEYQRRRFFWMRAVKLSGITARDLASLWRRQRGLCALTGDRLTRDNAEVDHILPKARGGDDSVANLRWTTRAVNRAKRDATDAEFAEMCGNVMRWLGRRIAMVAEIAAAEATPNDGAAA
jgi:5-methylcytosine-specific restriction endonuclease McrA